MKRVISFATVALILTGCASSQVTSNAEPLSTDDAGNLVLEYRDVEIPLMILRSTGSNKARVASGSQALRPSGPPSSYSTSQVTDYWIGATAEAMQRCGYVELRQRLRNQAQDRSAFAQGQNKLKGSAMVSCGKAKRLAEAILAHSPS